MHNFDTSRDSIIQSNQLAYYVGHELQMVALFELQHLLMNAFLEV